jgi:hypothetical protein
VHHHVQLTDGYLNLSDFLSRVALNGDQKDLILSSWDYRLEPQYWALRRNSVYPLDSWIDSGLNSTGNVAWSLASFL